MGFDYKMQDLLDKLASTARNTAEACSRAADLHVGNHLQKGSECAAKLREDIAVQLNRLHDLLDHNYE